MCSIDFELDATTINNEQMVQYDAAFSNWTPEHVLVPLKEHGFEVEPKKPKYDFENMMNKNNAVSSKQDEKQQQELSPTVDELMEICQKADEAAESLTDGDRLFAKALSAAVKGTQGKGKGPGGKKGNGDAAAFREWLKNSIASIATPSYGDAKTKKTSANDATQWHGSMANTNKNLEVPKAVALTDKLNRSGKEASEPMNGSEYVDAPETLDAKLAYVTQLLFKAQGDAVVYSGAGLSTSSGIKDYASVADNSVVRKNYGTSEAAGSRLDLKPSLGHHAVAALRKKKLVGHWINQNHDRLAQKAGFPQERLIEIHGAWGDHKNPVCSFDDALRPDLLAWLEELCVGVDGKGPKVCLVLGSSLCGMNADQIVKASQDVVIIGTGPTPYDDECTVRVWGLLDDVLSRLYSHHVCADDKSEHGKKLPRGDCARVGEKWVANHPSCRYHTPKPFRRPGDNTNVVLPSLVNTSPDYKAKGEKQKEKVGESENDKDSSEEVRASSRSSNESQSGKVSKDKVSENKKGYTTFAEKRSKEKVRVSQFARGHGAGASTYEVSGAGALSSSSRLTREATAALKM